MPDISVDSKLDSIADNILAFFPLYYRRILKPVSSRGAIPINAQFMTLSILKNNGAIKMGEIGQRMGISKPNVTLLVNKLIDKKLVKRIPDLNDRRIVHIRITEKGLKFLEARKAMAKKHIKEYLAGLSDEDQDRLYQIAEIFISLLLKPDTLNSNAHKSVISQGV